MAGGFRIAEAYVEVDIDQTRLAEQLAKVEFALLEVKDRAIKMGIDQGPLDMDIAVVQEKMDALQRRISLTPDLNQDEVDEGLARLIAKINTTRTRLNILPDTGEVRARLATLSAELKAMQDDVKVGFDPEEIAKGLVKVRTEFAAIAKETVKLGVNSEAINRAFEDIRVKLEVLHGGTVVDVKLRDVEVKAEIIELLGLLEKLQKEYSIKVDLKDVGSTLMELTAVNSVVETMTRHMSEFVKINTLPGLGGGRFWWVQWAHWIIAGGSELAAVVVPAMVALGAAGAVVAQGAQMAEIHMKALWTAAEATGQYLHQTLGSALGLRSALQQAQDAANPKVYQALGAAIDVVKQHVLSMASVGTNVLNIFDKFLAHFQYTLGPGGMGKAVAGPGGLLADMIPDLTMIMQIFGNLGHAILNLASDMPGLAGGMLLFLNAVSRVILAISQLPRWVIESFMVIEELYRWGGLAATVMSRLSSGIMNLGTLGVPVLKRLTLVFSTALEFIPMALAGMMVNLGGTISKLTLFGASGEAAGKAISGLGLKMVGFAEFMGGPWGMGIAAAAIALGGLFFWMSRMKTATEQWIDATNKSIESASSLHVLLPLQDALYNGQTKLVGAQRQLSQAQEQATRNTSAGFHAQIGYNFQIATAKKNVDELTQANQHYDVQLRNVLAGAGYLVGFYRTSFIGALALAAAAGVKLQDGLVGQGRDATIARIQIADYVQGLVAMGQPLGAIGNDMSALAIQSGLATTKVSQLNSAWDDFINNATGGETALSQLNLAFQGLGITGLKSTASLRGTTSSIDLVKQKAGSSSTAVAGFANSLTAAGQKGAQTWQQFNSAITGPGQQMLDWFRIAGAEGQISGRDLTAATRAIINQMLPMAQHSKAATAELSAMAQEAGGPFTTNFRQLKDWVDRGAHSMGGLRDIVNRTTERMANMSDVATKLGTTMQQMIVSEMDRAQLASSGLTTAVGKLTQYIKANGTVGIQQTGVYKQVLGILTQLTGSQATATSIISAYTDKVNTGDTAAKNMHDTLQTLNRMQNAYNTNVDQAHRPNQAFIGDLISIGQQAHIGMGKIASMIHTITGIPKSVIMKIEEQGIGHFSIQQYKSTGAGGQRYGGNLPGTTGGGAPFRSQKGMRVPGYGGGDKHLALLEGGEAVVPKEVVPHVAAILRRHGVPGFQGGAFIQAGDVGVDTGQATVLDYNRYKNTFTRSMESAMTAALKQAIATAHRAMMAGPGGPGVHAAMPYLEGLWDAAGGPPALAHLMAAIAMAESGGRSNAYNASGASGLWQILGVPFPGNPFDPLTNARMAVAKWRSQGLGAWVTYTSGAYRAYYANGTDGAMPGWGVVGEHGPEMVRFYGGEPVIPFVPRMMHGGMVPGYARGTGHMPASGAAVARDFAKIHNVTTAVNAIHHLLSDIHKYFTGHQERERSRLVHSQEHHLLNAVQELRHINNRIDAGRKYRASVLSNLSGYADISGLMAGGAYVGPQGSYLSGGGFLEYQLKQKLGNLRKFAGVLKQLGKAHVPAVLIRQIVAMGPDAGLEFANEILSGGGDLIKQLGKTEAEIAAAEKGVAAQAAGDVYAHGQLNIAGSFRRQRAQMDREVKHWAEVFGKEATHWFNVPRSQRPRHYQTGGTIPIGSMGTVGEAGLETVHATPYGAVVTPGDGSGGVTVVNQYYGTQYPTPEMQRRMNIDMALALGVAP